MRSTDGLQTTITLRPVNHQGPNLVVELALALTLPLPEQNPDLPHQIEAAVHHVGLEIQRQLFRVLIEKADSQLVLKQRQGKSGKGIQRRGTRPFTFKTIFGSVTVGRTRISHKADGSIETPSATAWQTPHQLAMTDHLRQAVCDQMGQHSAAKSRAQIGHQAGEEDLLGRSTCLAIVHDEGQQLVAAERHRAEVVLDTLPPAQLALLGSFRPNGPQDEEVDDTPPVAPSDEDTPSEPIEVATGFAGGEPVGPVGRSEPRQVDPGFVIVQPDEVKTKAQLHTGRKEVWIFTAVLLAAGSRHVVAEASAAQLWRRVGALLSELGVLSGHRRLLVLGDGAAWIRSWFAGLELPGKAMVLCWWHLRKRCYESLSTAGGPKDRRQELEKAVLGDLWKGDVDGALSRLDAAGEWVRVPAAVGTLMGYLEKRRAFLPDYQERQRAGLWIASTRVEKFNDWAVSNRCKHQGMSWSPLGVLSLAALEATRRNGELDYWRQIKELPESLTPKQVTKAA